MDGEQRREHAGRLRADSRLSLITYKLSVVLGSGLVSVGSGLRFGYEVGLIVLGIVTLIMSVYAAERLN